MLECPDFYPMATTANGTGKVSLNLTRFEYYKVDEYTAASETYMPDAALHDGNDGLRYDYGNFYASEMFLCSGR
jgi:beta-fructofuranosidase